MKLLLKYADNETLNSFKQQLIQRTNIDGRNRKDRYNAFMAACNKGHRGVVQLRLEHHSDLNLDLNAKWLGSTAFMLACYAGRTDTVQYLLNKSDKIDVNAIDSYGRTGLMIACVRGKLDVVQLLMDHAEDMRIDLNVKDNLGRNGFLLSCEYGHENVAKILLV